jgi:hypothetical protein
MIVCLILILLKEQENKKAGYMHVLLAGFVRFSFSERKKRMRILWADGRENEPNETRTPHFYARSSAPSWWSMYICSIEGVTRDAAFRFCLPADLLRLASRGIVGLDAARL